MTCDGFAFIVAVDRQLDFSQMDSHALPFTVSSGCHCFPLARLQHSQANAAHMLGACLVSAIDTACNRCCAVVVEVVVEGAVTCTKSLLFEKQRVVKKGESVEDIKVGLTISA